MKKSNKKTIGSSINMITPPVVKEDSAIAMDIVEVEKPIVPKYRRTKSGVVVDAGEEKGSYHIDLFPMVLGGTLRSREWAINLKSV